MIEDGKIVLLPFPNTDQNLVIGSIGRVSASRLKAIRGRLGDWISTARQDINGLARR
jgi:hypothetical protein